VQGDCKETV